MTSYEFAYVLEDMGLAFLPGLISGIPSFAIGIAAYILSAMALYTMATRRGIHHPWMSWVPVLNIWIVGSLSDQYRYVVKGQYKSRRKALLILEILKAVLALCMIVICIYMVVSLLGGWIYEAGLDAVSEEILIPLMSILGLSVPLMGVTIAAMVLRYMAMYDIYVSCDPANSVLFLVLSILVGITEPFFLFFSRNKDLGMPPRKSAPASAAVDAEVI